MLSTMRRPSNSSAKSGCSAASRSQATELPSARADATRRSAFLSRVIEAPHERRQPDECTRNHESGGVRGRAPERLGHLRVVEAKVDSEYDSLPMLTRESRKRHVVGLECLSTDRLLKRRRVGADESVTQFQGLHHF